MPPVIGKTKCDGCGICVNICPEDIFFGSAKKQVPQIAYPEECWHCGSCKLDCPREAIRLRIPLPAMLCYDSEPA